jgi:hypothetical protein
VTLGKIAQKLVEGANHVPPPEFIEHVTVNGEDFRGGKGSDVNRAQWLPLARSYPTDERTVRRDQ